MGLRATELPSLYNYCCRPRNVLRAEQHYLPLRTFPPSIGVRTIESIPLSVRFWLLRGKTLTVGYPDATHPIATMKINLHNVRVLSFLEKNKIFVRVRRTREAHWSIMRRVRSPRQPCPQEAMHSIQMLQKESNSGQMHDLARVRSEGCLADSLTKHSAESGLPATQSTDPSIALAGVAIVGNLGMTHVHGI